MKKITISSSSTKEEIEIQIMELLMTTDEQDILIVDENDNIIKQI